MKRLRRVGRGPDGWSSPHMRARTRAAERLVEPLDPEEAHWLERHLSDCGRCASAAAAYDQQQRELRSLASIDLVPPRDLWARTAAAIEREAGSRGHPAAARRPRRSRVPLGVASGMLVVLVVVGASLMSRSAVPILRPSPPPIAGVETPSPAVPAATPLGVNAGDVAWLRSENGRYQLYLARIREVCPVRDRGTCAPLDDPRPRTLDLRNAPGSVVVSPSSGELVIFDQSSQSGGGTIYVVPPPTMPPEPGSSPGALPTEMLSPTPSAEPSSGASPVPLPTIPTSPTPDLRPSPSPDLSPSPSPDASPSQPPDPSPSPMPEGAVAIATDVIVVGDAAAYSPDGRWFAFSARPADGSHGPDIYLWSAGETEARRVTDDHASVLASWLGDQILVSRAVAADGADGVGPGLGADPEPVATNGTTPSADPDTTPDPGHLAVFLPQVVLIDPETGEETAVQDAPFWRPTVDPTGTSAIYWEGTLVLDEDGVTWRPGVGRLVLGPWPAAAIPLGQGTDGPEAGEPPSERPASTPGPAPSPSSSPDLPSFVLEVQEIETGRLLDWDVRWNASGTRFAVWIADAVDPSIGRLSLFAVDPETGLIDADDGPLRNIPALSGFSLTDRHLAWVTPAGQDGQGSRVQVLAWMGDDTGTVETLPGDEPIVIIR